MSSKHKILFVYDHKYPDLWQDGLWAALNLLEEHFAIGIYNLAYISEGEEIVPLNDFILGWGAFGSKVDRYIQNCKQTGSKKVGLCIAGNAFPPTGAANYDVLFYETKWYRPQIKFHPNIVQAFGINTDIYFPIGESPVPMWDYIGVGALANWKRWDRMTGKDGLRLVVGEYQEGNQAESAEIANYLLNRGVAVSPMVPPYDLARLYRLSKRCYIPADIYGGGERAVLEARSCGLEVEIEDDNPKLKELVELETIPSHIDYAAQLKKGILSCL